MLTCRHWDKFIDDYLSGRLSRLKRFIFCAHMVLCPPCKRYLDEYARTLEATRRQAQADDAATTPLPTGLAESLTKCMCQPDEERTK
jgi:hypothetical protein